MPPSLPAVQIYDGRRDAETVDELLASLELYFCLKHKKKEIQLSLASSLLNKDARLSGSI